MAILSQKTIIGKEKDSCTIQAPDTKKIIKFGIIVDKELLTREAEKNLCFSVKDSDGNIEKFYMNDIGIFEADEVSISDIEIKNITKDMEVIVDYIME